VTPSASPPSPPRSERGVTVYPLYRLQNPANEQEFYSKATAEWVTHGYTKWRREDWVHAFKVDTVLADGRIVDDQGRMWEGFGFVIPLYDEGEE